MSSKDAVIAAIYAQLEAPDWAARNLDALADVLRDLSWLPPGSVRLDVPDLSGLPAGDRDALLRVLRRAATESRTSPHPVHLG